MLRIYIQIWERSMCEVIFGWRGKEFQLLYRKIVVMMIVKGFEMNNTITLHAYSYSMHRNDTATQVYRLPCHSLYFQPDHTPIPMARERYSGAGLLERWKESDGKH